MMSTPVIEFNGVTIDLPIYSIGARSLRSTTLNLSTGGRLFQARNHHVVVRALNSVSFKINPGDRVGLTGHNGSGKTTLLRAIAGIYKPAVGTAVVRGEISPMLELATGLDPEASGVENIRLLSKYRGRTDKEIDREFDAIAEFTELGAYLQMPVKTYSQGMLARLSFAVATSFSPDVLVMDEWIAAGDAAFVKKAEARLLSLIESARVFIFASHSVDLVERLCNRTMHLNHGSLEEVQR